MERPYRNPEPVPAASQLAVLPLVAAVDGFLRQEGDIPGLRITIHRTMSREGNDYLQGYLQQVCAYLGQDEPEWKGQVGRILPVDIGIIGAAFKNHLIWRTKHYPCFHELRPDLQKDIGDQKRPEDVACSFLAVPFLGP